MADHNELGKKGEQLAVEWLTDKGYTILETNWRFEKAEVDIIARDREELVIVEVKTRSTDFFGLPEEAVDTNKENLLVGAAEAYVEMNNLDIDVRYDIIAIVLQSGKARIRHIRDAFYPGL